LEDPSLKDYILRMRIFPISFLFILTSCLPSFNPTKLKFSVKSVTSPGASAEESRAFTSLKSGVLTAQCLTCHGTWKAEAVFVSRGIVPGDPEGSSKYQSVLSGRMPKNKPHLTQGQMDLFKNYILSLKKTDSPSFAEFKAKVLEPNKCLKCHALMRNEDAVLKYVKKGDAENSKLFKVVLDGSMPKNSPALTTAEIELVRDYINHFTLRTTAR
jgi:hypothetical protein